MKKVFITIFYVLFPYFLCFAGDNFPFSFFSLIKESRIQFDYSYSINQKVKITGSGNVLLQDSAFVMISKALEIYCDGKTSWTVDKDSKEVVIEEIAKSSYNLTNPAILLNDMEKSFVKTFERTELFLGEKAQSVFMKPVIETEIAMVKLYFSFFQLDGASMIFIDGTQIDFLFRKWKFSKKSDDMSVFSFNESKLDSSFVVSDLR